jgi:hypothetical protein
LSSAAVIRAGDKTSCHQGSLCIEIVQKTNFKFEEISFENDFGF